MCDGPIQDWKYWYDRWLSETTGLEMQLADRDKALAEAQAEIERLGDDITGMVKDNTLLLQQNQASREFVAAERKAKDKYNQALADREHGDVAAHRYMDEVDEARQKLEDCK